MPKGVYKRTNKARRNMRKAHLGVKLSKEHARNIGRSHLGRKNTDETRRKMSKSAIKSGTGKWMKGIVKTIEWRRNLSKSHQGELNYNWKGGITAKNKKIRSSLEYKLWREEIFRRDNFTCQMCAKRGVELNADHIKTFSEFPHLRFDVSNGRTLCVPCHREVTKKWHFKKNKPKKDENKTK